MSVGLVDFDRGSHLSDHRFLLFIRLALALSISKSYCILMTGGKVSPDAEQRLDAMVRTQDGFELAELDLQLRGPGEFFGTRQAGLPDFRIANLVRDRELLELAKREASAFVAAGGAEATEAERAIVAARLKQAWQRRYGLVEAG